MLKPILAAANRIGFACGLALRIGQGLGAGRGKLVPGGMGRGREGSGAAGSAPALVPGPSRCGERHNTPPRKNEGFCGGGNMFWGGEGVCYAMPRGIVTEGDVTEVVS